MNPAKPREGRYQSRTVAGLLRLAGWAAAWTAATLLMKHGPRVLWDKASPFTLMAVGLDVAAGIGLILAHKTWIAELDDLQRKIYLDAMGITLGVTLIAGVVYEFLDKSGIIHFQFSNLLILMSATFLASNFYGTWRYR